MPFEISKNTEEAIVRAWPHQSLPRRGFVWFIGITSALLLLPAMGLLGTLALWGILPFLLLAIMLVWFFLMRSYNDRSIIETLVATPIDVVLERQNPNGPVQTWRANPYWVKVEVINDAGPVPNYVTLTGGERTVEIGAFLTEEERSDLARELSRILPWR